jgi:hypothetical protein
VSRRRGTIGGVVEQGHSHGCVDMSVGVSVSVSVSVCV